MNAVRKMEGLPPFPGFHETTPDVHSKRRSAKQRQLMNRYEGNNDYHSINNDYHSINNDYHSTTHEQVRREGGEGRGEGGGRWQL
jgi:hypothetical protein